MLYLADGSVRLRVVEVRASTHEVDAEIEVGGAVASRQGLNIPGPTESLPSVPEEDLELLRHGESIGVDMVALSFVQRPEDVETVRSHTRLPLIAKMEKPQAVERAEEIVSAADCVMVARGDLGIELRDRARADRAEAAAARSPGTWRARRSRPRRCSTRWSPPRAPPAPRSPTWPTRSSTAPTR